MNTAIAATFAIMALKLGYDPAQPPIYVTASEAATALGVRPATLAEWRRTGRHGVPFIKKGRKISYRLIDLARHAHGHVFPHPECNAGHVIRD